jgi:hypothetical protein
MQYGRNIGQHEKNHHGPAAQIGGHAQIIPEDHRNHRQAADQRDCNLAPASEANRLTFGMLVSDIQDWKEQAESEYVKKKKHEAD